MQELDRILIAVNYSQDLNKENLVDKIQTEIEAKLNEENLGEYTKKNLKRYLEQWKKDNFDLKKFPYSDSLLHLAAKLNCAELAKALIESGVDVNDGFPLHCAAQRGHVQVAEILLAAKADVNMQDRYELTPLDYTVELGNKIEMVKLLLKKGATNNVQNRCGFTPLHHTAQRGYVQMAETLLKEGGSDVNVQDKNGKTPLHYATDGEGEHIQVTKVLLQKEAKVDLQDKDGKTPLHYAAENEYTQIAEALLKGGAGVDVQDKDGRTPLYYAVYYTHGEHPRLNYHNPKVAKLLLEHGADQSCIHRPKAITAGVATGVIAAIAVPLALVCATALPTLAIVGVTAASVLIAGGIAYGVAYKSSEHSLNSTLSEISCNNAQQTQTTAASLP